MRALFRLCCVLLALTGAPLLAQSADEAATDAPTPEAASAAATADSAADAETPDVRATLAALFDDISDWEDTAQRAEETLAGDSASTFALNRLREKLVAWRERFAARLSENQSRISTIDAQLAALGTPAEGEEEPATIADRRSELAQQRDRFAVPDALVAEAFARANGLLSEIDAALRALDARKLLERGASPLNPAYWPAAVASLGQSLSLMATDMRAGTNADLADGSIWSNLPFILLGVGLGAVLLLRSRRWVLGLVDGLSELTPRRRAVWSFIISLGQIALPLLGLLLIVLSLRAIDLSSPRMDTMLNALLSAVSVIILARWLNDKLFPPGPSLGPLSYGPEVNQRIRRIGITLSWGLAAIVLLQAAMSLVDAAPVSLAVVQFPVMIFLALVLYQLGNALRQPPVDDPAYSGSGGRVRAIVGRLCMGVAIASPIFAGLGYASAASGLFRPAILTLVILGVVVVLQRLASDIYDPPDAKDSDDTGPLMPVLIGLAIGVLALPFLALAWGVRVADLQELWTRIMTGFALGETRISPTDFFAFLLVFAIGYLITRFVQSTLRTAILPRTRLDLGGQNAIISGVGYVGIMLSGIVAITSAGIDLTSLAFVAGALSLGIGFGLQNIVQNFVSGIILLIERPIGEGDMIEVGGQMGFVRDISVRSTRIETFDRTDVIIPNADLVSGTVTNWTRGNPVGRLIVPVGVAYGSDVEEVRTILKDVADNHPMALMDPPPQVFFMGFGASSLDFEIRVQLRDVNWKIVTLSEMNFEINARFAAAGIEIPFPQQDLWLRNPETLKGDPSA